MRRWPRHVGEKQDGKKEECVCKEEEKGLKNTGVSIGSFEKRRVRPSSKSSPPWTHLKAFISSFSQEKKTVG